MSWGRGVIISGAVVAAAWTWAVASAVRLTSAHTQTLASTVLIKKILIGHRLSTTASKPSWHASCMPLSKVSEHVPTLHTCRSEVLLELNNNGYTRL